MRPVPPNAMTVFLFSAELMVSTNSSHFCDTARVIGRQLDHLPWRPPTSCTWPKARVTLVPLGNSNHTINSGWKPRAKNKTRSLRVQATRCCFVHGVAGSHCSVGCDVTEPRHWGGMDASEQTPGQSWGLSEGWGVLSNTAAPLFLYYQHDTGSGRIQLNLSVS